MRAFIHSSIWILDQGSARVPFYGVGSTRLCLTPDFHAYLTCGSMAARSHILTSVFTHSDHVFLGLPRPLVSGIGRSVTDSMQDVAHCTCPFHLSCRLWRTAIIFLMPCFCSSEAEGVSSRSLGIQEITARSLRWRPCMSVVSMAERMQASYTLPST